MHPRTDRTGRRDETGTASRTGISKKAEAEYKGELLESIMETATRQKNPQWTAAAWLLERKYPDEYAQTARKNEDAGENAPQIVLGVTAQAVNGGGDA